MSRQPHTIVQASLGALVILLCLAPFSPAEAQIAVPIRTVTAVGSSPVRGDNLAQARSQAISDSLLNAVAQVTAQLLPPDAMVQDFQVIDRILLAHTDKVIQDYQVLSTSRSAKLYRVMVQASVLVGKIEDELSSVGIVLLKKTMPSILLLISEQDHADPLARYWWGGDLFFATVFSERSMTESMDERGFSVIDHDALPFDIMVETRSLSMELSDEEALDLGVRCEAGVVIIGKAGERETANVMESKTRSYRATLTARALRTDSGEEIGSTNQAAMVMSVDEAIGGMEALSEVGKRAGAEIARKIAALWQERQDELTGIEVLVQGTSNLANLVELRKVIYATPGVKRIRTQEMTVDQTVIVVDFEGTERALADALMLHPFSSFGVNIHDISPSHLSISFVIDDKPSQESRSRPRSRRGPMKERNIFADM